MGSRGSKNVQSKALLKEALLEQLKWKDLQIHDLAEEVRAAKTAAQEQTAAIEAVKAECEQRIADETDKRQLVSATYEAEKLALAVRADASRQMIAERLQVSQSAQAKSRLQRTVRVQSLAKRPSARRRADRATAARAVQANRLATADAGTTTLKALQARDLQKAAEDVQWMKAQVYAADCERSRLEQIAASQATVVARISAEVQTATGELAKALKMKKMAQSAARHAKSSTRRLRNQAARDICCHDFGFGFGLVCCCCCCCCRCCCC
jgi:hypothetical protein